jgi:hypothetical protein
MFFDKGVHDPISKRTLATKNPSVYPTTGLQALLVAEIRAPTK